MRWQVAFRPRRCYPRLQNRGKFLGPIALAVAAAAEREGLVPARKTEELERLVDARIWQPRYLPIRLAKPL